MDNTIILPCSCNNAYQDEQYGKGRRLHNISQIKGGGNSSNKDAKCTVCGTKRSFGGGSKPIVEKKPEASNNP